MTLEEFYKSTKDMPMDAEVMKVTIDIRGVFIAPVTSIEHDGTNNWITIC